MNGPISTEVDAAHARVCKVVEHAEHYGTRTRLLCPYMAKENRLALDTGDEFLGLTDTTVLFDNGQAESLHSLMGLLHSRLLTWRFRSIGKLKSGGIYEYFWNSISRLPIRRIDFDSPLDRARHDRLVLLVGQMLAAMSQESGGRDAELRDRKCAAIDRQIDQLVYDLYGMTDQEIALVEGHA